jgi:hypothetical protein
MPASDAIAAARRTSRANASGVPAKGVSKLSGSSIVKVPARWEVLMIVSSAARFFQYPRF